jgi:hypothetical protein
MIRSFEADARTQLTSFCGEVGEFEEIFQRLFIDKAREQQSQEREQVDWQVMEELRMRIKGDAVIKCCSDALYLAQLSGMGVQ